MNMRIHIRPAPGRVVRNEQRQLLPEAGKEVESSPFWSRRLADGDVLLVTEPKPALTKGKP